MKRLAWTMPLCAALSYAVWRHYALSCYAAGLPPFDLRLFRYDEAQRYLAALTPEAKATLLGPLHRADAALLVSLAATLMLPVWRRGWPLCLPALAYAVCDLAENAAVSVLLRTGLHEAGEIATLSLLTGAKFVCLGLAVVLALWALWRGWYGQRAATRRR